MGNGIWGKYIEPDVEAEFNLVCLSHLVSGMCGTVWHCIYVYLLPGMYIQNLNWSSVGKIFCVLVRVRRFAWVIVMLECSACCSEVVMIQERRQG